MKLGLQPGSAACGPVYQDSKSLPPVPSKWDTVPVLNGRVKRKVGAKFVNVEKEDLAKMASSKPRQVCALAGFAIAGAYPVVSARSEYNAFKALLARVFRPPRHSPDPAAWGRAHELLECLMPGFREPLEPMVFDEWLAGMPARRQKALRAAHLEYNRFGWRDSYKKFQAFVKAEKLAGYDKRNGVLTESENLIDRLIQAPHDVTHTIAGPFLRPLVKRLKQVWSFDSKIFYASRKGSENQTWIDQQLSGGPFTAFAVDYSMFDNSHSAITWELMESIYKRCGSDVVPDFSKVMQAWRRPNGTISGKGFCLSYKGPTMNCSGRDDTALANGVLNGIAIFMSSTAALFKKKVESLTVQDLHKSPIRVAVCGDDSLGFMPMLPQEEAELFGVRLSQKIARFGFDADHTKLEIIHNDPIRLVFLGQRPYPVRNASLPGGVRWLFGKTLGRALFKFGWKLNPGGDLAAWFAGECVAAIKTQAHVPILYDLAENYMKTRVGCKVTRVTEEDIEYKPWKDLPDSAQPYDDLTVSAIAGLYGVSVSQLTELLAHIKMEPFVYPCVLSHPVLERMVMVDEA